MTLKEFHKMMVRKSYGFTLSKPYDIQWVATFEAGAHSSYYCSAKTKRGAFMEVTQRQIDGDYLK